jgi:hypothetical protein
MLKKYIDQINQKFEQIQWQPRQPKTAYEHMLMEAKEAGYIFDLYVDSNIVTFQADDIELFKNRIVFKKDQAAFSIQHLDIRRVRPLLKERRVEIITSRSFRFIFFLIPLLLLVLGLIFYGISQDGTNKSINQLIVPSLKHEIDWFMFDYDNDLGGARYYSGPSREELLNFVELLVMKYAFNWFGQVLIISGFLVTLWTIVLTFYSRRADRNILITENSIRSLERGIPPTPENTPADVGKKPVELFLEFFKILVWPMIAVSLLIIFWKPVQGVAGQFPDMAKRANTIAFNDIIITLKDDLPLNGVAPSEDVRQVLMSLSPNDISALIELRGNACYSEESVLYAKRRYVGLISLGLVNEVNKDIGENTNCVYWIEPSPLGEKTQEYLSKVLTSFVRQLNPPVATPTPTASVSIATGLP